MKMKPLVFTMMMALLGIGSAQAGEPGPREVIESTVNNIIQVLEQRPAQGKLTEADRDRIREVVEGHFDYRAMAKRSLGRPWKKLSEAEKVHFTEVFRELLERSYGNRLNEYHGQKVVFHDAELKKNKARVKSEVIDASKEIPIEYRLHQTPSGWQVYDIRVEGTSMIRTFHQDFKATLESSGYDGLLKSLEDKVAKLRAKDLSGA